MSSGVDPLDRDALTRILIEPKNSLTRQYEHLLSLDNVELKFEVSALGAAADLAMARGTGARGLRSIIEKCLLDVMFEVPGRDTIRKVVIDDAVINGEKRPIIMNKEGDELDWDEENNDPARPAA